METSANQQIRSQSDRLIGSTIRDRLDPGPDLRRHHMIAMDVTSTASSSPPRNSSLHGMTRARRGQRARSELPVLVGSLRAVERGTAFSVLVLPPA